jgi:16S rRNA G966 N2-methylase RsmD
LIPISEINSANRFRKDLGDIRPLASSIAEVGLMHPIVVKNGEARNYQLIAGLRRLEACKLLGWKKVPVTILDIEEIITGELHENVVRKDFVMSERIAILEEIERQRLGHRVSKERVANCTPFQNEQKGRKSRTIAAAFTGISERQISKEQFITKAARDNPSKFSGLIGKIDSGKFPVDSAYKLIKDELWKAKQIAENKLTETSFNKIASNDQIRLLEGDFRKVALQEIKASSVDIIFTDPPYDRQSLSLYRDLATIAEILLRQGGSLITYIGQYALPDILNYIENVGNLTFWWQLYVLLEGPYPRYFDRQFVVKIKPLLWFVKGDRPSNPSFPKSKDSEKRNFISDLIVSKTPDKRFHNFGQSPTDAEYVLKYLTAKNDLVLDLFLGGGATAIACMKLQRRFVGIDIDLEAIEAAKANLRINCSSLAT